MKELTKRQVCILIAFITISFKVHRLPALMSEYFGRDFWIAMLVLFLCDFVMFLVVLKVIKKLGDKTVFDFVEQKCGKAGLICFCVLTIAFFFFKSIISYKQLHEFFANTLFDKLEWKIFSILFLCLLILMVGSGVKNIARQCELYVYIIGFSMFAILIFGASVADYSRIMPILDYEYNSDTLLNVFKFASWFTDAPFMLFLAGRIKTKNDSNKAYIFSYLISIVVVIFSSITFYSINENMSGIEDNALSSLTEYTLIGLGVGRPDWFLVLIVVMASIISTAFELWIVTMSLSIIFDLKVNYFMSAVVMIIVAVFDSLVLRNVELGVAFMQNIASPFMIGYSILIPLFVLLVTTKNRLRGKVYG